MSRVLRIGGAQMGPIHKADSRQAVVRRMLDCSIRRRPKCDFVVYPELALTTFFPRWYMTDRPRSMPGSSARCRMPRRGRCSSRPRSIAIGMSFGYAELTADGQHFNTAIWSIGMAIVGKYRKVHLPGHSEFDPQRAFQHLEKRYFEPGDLGFPVWRAHGRHCRHVHLQ